MVLWNDMSQVVKGEENARAHATMGGPEWQTSQDARASSDPLLIKHPANDSPPAHSNIGSLGSSLQSLSERTNSIQQNPPFDHWRIHWTTPSSIAELFILSILCDLSHHLYYDSLHYKPSTEVSQEYAIRIGTSLAFLFKACLGASAAMVYRQYYWTILRTRDMSIQSIDNIMGLLSDPTCFASLDIIRNASSCVFIALIIW
ncbi:hypothetical protein NW762_010331 [Fusarium torreyae]|uniref:Uncharacterized protein n=1 Tax=Fusarium torreyae TaxID=1237075 RepID=A0A9W8VDS4_9HYPO|nr:hypothetical protein NW762_010331 [Fusarium torreyae]